MNAHITQSLQLERARRAAFAPFVMPLRLPSFSQVPGALMLWVLLGALALPSIAAAEFVFPVNDTRDLSDASPGDSLCATAENTCTLRAAIEEINASSLPGSSCGVLDFANRVILPAGTYKLATKSPSLDIGRDENDRDVCVYIVGTGYGATEINGSSTEGLEGTIHDERPERVFFIRPRGRLYLDGVKIMQGHTHNTGGGAIINLGGDLAISKSLLTKNSTHSRGGAIYNTGNLWILESTLSDNWARPNTLPNFDGGREDTDIDGDGIADKIAGGALVNVGGRVYTQNVTISGNSGGGINPHTNSDSKGDGGAGILNVRGGVFQISNTTIANNFADGTSGSNGAGIYNDRNSTVYFSNTIVANNSSAVRPKDKKNPDDCRGTLKSSGYNLVGAEPSNCMIDLGPGDQIGDAFAPIKLLLGDLSDYGGPTPTHSLLDGSPAIDAANGDCAATDQRYLPRPKDGPTQNGYDGVAICDIGAYEHGVPEISVSEVKVTEGNSGQKSMIFELRLSYPSVEPLAVLFGVTDGTAQANSDYFPTSGEMPFDLGGVSAKISVSILGDRDKELDETLLLNIAPSIGPVRFKNDQTIGTIVNDDF